MIDWRQYRDLGKWTTLQPTVAGYYFANHKENGVLHVKVKPVWYYYGKDLTGIELQAEWHSPGSWECCQLHFFTHWQYAPPPIALPNPPQEQST